MKAEGKKSRTVFPDPRLLCPRRSVRPCRNEEQTRTSLSQLVVEQEFRSSLVTHACRGAEAFPSNAVLCDGACQIPLAPDPRYDAYVHGDPLIGLLPSSPPSISEIGFALGASLYRGRLLP
jgi:hypothetical protein